MSSHPNSLCDRDALLEKALSLTPELFSLILDCCIGTPTLIAYEYESLPHICPRYETEACPSGLPRHCEAEYDWLVRQKWLRSQKAFSEATPFVMTHIACLKHCGTFDVVPVSRSSMNIDETRMLTPPMKLQSYFQQPSRLPLIMQPCPKLNLTGLESIELDLSTDAFFLVFEVSAPPFPAPDHFYHDETLLGAGTYLAHTRKLTLTFTTMNPWFNLWAGPWAEDDENMRPGERGNVCTSGLVVDWILTYAWHHGYLQHIHRVELRGDIQEWVKEKWYQVFAGTHPEKDDIASRQRIHEIEHHGEQETVAMGERWIASEHYPPTCRCEVSCSRLRWGVVEPEMLSAKWENDAQGDFPPVETLPWYNKMETDW
ncbi:hypothetical protein P171DRAFT_194540 [Karstenula rhodostoma CBS 690.94]|uniref:Uncharacterized protein n=1 Tax=Karstenula rhodostoma CBS 690.94 TaxID=1392251 RepID=A0A9P4UGT4_9PLEO|nr:hypothetical protein P171DRAFT_194540 [Karstenula rhodostoma CBS 690.94]